MPEGCCQGSSGRWVPHTPRMRLCLPEGARQGGATLSHLSPLGFSSFSSTSPCASAGPTPQPQPSPGFPAGGVGGEHDWGPPHPPAPSPFLPQPPTTSLQGQDQLEHPSPCLQGWAVSLSPFPQPHSQAALMLPACTPARPSPLALLSFPAPSVSFPAPHPPKLPPTPSPSQRQHQK